MAESEGRRGLPWLPWWVLNLVLAPGDRLPMSSVLEDESGGSLEVGMCGTIRSGGEYT